MPAPASTVGPLVRPVPAGALFSAVDDPTLSGLGAYFAFWLNYDLNAKLTSLQTTREDGSLITQAVPAGNVFCWSPFKPNAFFTRGQGDGAEHPLPALYVWDESDKGRRFSQLYGMRERAIKAAWIFDQALFPGWLEDRFGLRAAACATLFAAIEQRYHPGFNPRAAITVQLSLSGEGIRYDGSERGAMAPRPDTVTGSDQPNVRTYPTAIVSLTVWEREDGQTALPSDATPDLQVSIATGDDPGRPLPAWTPVFPAPPYPTTT